MIVEHISELWTRFRTDEWEALLHSGAILAGAMLLGLVAASIVARVFGYHARRAKRERARILLRPENWRGPLRALLPAMAAQMAMPLTLFPFGLGPVVRQAINIWFIAALAWTAIRLVRVARDMILCSYDISAKDNLKARAVTTQMRVIEQVLIAIVLVVALATMLMTFETVRQVGVSLLASAGIAGIVLGFAAQKSIATLLAGIQIAITQPIRLDDVVIIENEWGRIEEITLTYVVVKIWDLRRLVVPITYFIEKPFQNWTRTEANILGTVFFYLDYDVPIQPLREEFQRVLEAMPEWDRKVGVLQVTNLTERIVEVRALLSAPDAGVAFGMRCQVRERLLEFLRARYPQSLPRFRVTLDASNASEGRPGFTPEGHGEQ